MRQNNNNSNNNNNRNRMRGRGRKSSNPMNRNFESNGPDVKIRGNAGHIAEKYMNLARDAQTSGDPVMAENYYQHAEHYNRIVALAQQNSATQQPPKSNDEGRTSNGSGPQPEIDGMPAEVALDDDGDGDDSQEVAEQPAETKPRARKNSRSRSKPVAAEESGEAVVEAGSDEQSENVAEVKPRSRTRRPRVKKDENVSDDAAKLPGSLTAAPVAVEEDSAAVAED